MPGFYIFKFKINNIRNQYSAGLRSTYFLSIATRQTLKNQKIFRCKTVKSDKLGNNFQKTYF